jgi:rhodanese-related sulfurtransferase
MPTEIGREDVRRLVDDGAVVAEVLPPEEYETEHITGAINIPLEKLDAARVARFERDRPIVVYCNDHQ